MPTVNRNLLYIGVAALLGLVESEVTFSSAKLFFAYGLGNALSFPLSVGATVLLMAERPDLIALGGLSVLVGSAVPDLPRRVAWPLTAGAWTNAHASGVLAFKPEWKDSRVYQAAVAGSFAAVTWGHVGLAVLAAKRRWER